VRHLSKDHACQCEYRVCANGLGYAGRPSGPMPTITVSLQNLPFEFFFLRGLMGFHDFQIPASTVSLTAEDLSSRAHRFDPSCYSPCTA